VELNPLGGIEWYENNTYCTTHFRFFFFFFFFFFISISFPSSMGSSYLCRGSFDRNREASAPKCAGCQGPLLSFWVDVGKKPLSVVSGVLEFDGTACDVFLWLCSCCFAKKATKHITKTVSSARSAR